MKPEKAYPPRIHVIVARDAPVAVVFRRGPTKVAATFLWDLDRDTVTVGQWFKGRIYPMRADLSPDGKHMIYFAMDGRWSSESKGSWTAVSRAPFLKALAFYPKGDCWYGGGLWRDNHQYWLNDGELKAIRLSSDVVQTHKIELPAGRTSGECPGVYFNRLMRDGWQFIHQVNIGRHKTEDVFDRRISDNARLVKHFRAELDHPEGKGVYWEEHKIIGPERQLIAAFPEWEWADVYSSNILWASAGCLYRGEVGTDGILKETMVADLNGLQFEAIAAPY